MRDILRFRDGVEALVGERWQDYFASSFWLKFLAWLNGAVASLSNHSLNRFYYTADVTLLDGVTTSGLQMRRVFVKTRPINTPDVIYACSFGRTSATFGQRNFPVTFVRKENENVGHCVTLRL